MTLPTHNETNVNIYLDAAKNAVIQSLNIQGHEMRPEEFYIVWFTKTLQNWKAMVATIYPDDFYFEVTYNGDRLEAYVDKYIREDNVSIPNNVGQLYKITT